MVRCAVLFVLLHTGADGFLANRIEVQGGSIKDEMIEIPQSGNVSVSITASSQGGELRGFVADGDRPLEGVFAILLPDPAFKNDNPVGLPPQIYQTESDGSFDYRLVPAGRYVFFATADADLEYAQPEIVAPYLTRAKQIEIRAGASVEERIPVTQVGLSSPGQQ